MSAHVRRGDPYPGLVATLNVCKIRLLLDSGMHCFQENMSWSTGKWPHPKMIAGQAPMFICWFSIGLTGQRCGGVRSCNLTGHPDVIISHNQPDSAQSNRGGAAVIKYTNSNGGERGVHYRFIWYAAIIQRWRKVSIRGENFLVGFLSILPKCGDHASEVRKRFIIRYEWYFVELSSLY